MSAAITPLPPVPDRRSPADFSDAADAFLLALTTFVAEANALSAEVSAESASAVLQPGLAAAQVAVAVDNAGKTAADVLSTAANVVSAGAAAGATRWISGVTYEIGNCVWSPINYAAYRRTTNGAGTIDPSLDAGNYKPVVPSATVQTITNGDTAHSPSGSAVFSALATKQAAIVPAGALGVSSAVSVVLTSLSVQVQNISMNALGLAVVMPNATTIAGPGLLYLIRNSGNNAYDVQDSSGACIFAGLLPNKSVIVWLRDNTTAAGQWALTGNQGVQSALNSGLASIFYNGNASNGVTSCPLNSTQALVAYCTGGNYSYVAVLTLTGSTITVGPAAPLANGTLVYPYAINCCQVGANHALIVTGESRVYSVTTAESIATVGSWVPFGVNSGGASACEAVSVAPAGAGQAIITYQTAAGHAINACVVTYDSSNNICVAGQANSVGAATNGTVCLSNIGTDTILATYQTGVSIYGYVLTGSGGVYTKGATYTLVNAQAVNGYQNSSQSCYIGSNQAMLIYVDTANSSKVSAVDISISGTVLSVNTKATISNTAPTGGTELNLLCQLSTGNALALICVGVVPTLFAMSVSGTTITVGAGVMATGTGNSYHPGLAVLCQTNTNKAALLYWDGSTSLLGRVISVSGTTITYNSSASCLSSGISGSALSLSICQINTDAAAFSFYYDGAGMSYLGVVSTATTTATFGSFVTVPNTSAGCIVGIAPTAATGAFCISVAMGGWYGNFMQGFTVSGTTITSGTQNTDYWPTQASQPSYQIVGAYSSSGKAIFAMGDGVNTTNYYTLLAQVSGLTVTAPVIGYTLGTNGYTSFPVIASAVYGSGTALLAYSDASGNLQARIATLSGYSLSFGSTTQIESPYVTATSISCLSGTSWVLASCMSGAAPYRMHVITVSGTTITSNTVATFGVSPTVLNSVTVAVISTTLVLVSYKVGTGSLITALYSISGTTLILLYSVTSSAVGESNLTSCTLGSTMLLCYSDYLSPYYGKCQAIQYVKE